MRRPRGARRATLQLYRTRHADGAAFLWYARTALEALTAARHRTPPQAGRVVRLELVAFDV